MPTHYEVLKVAENATHDDIRRAYHDQARRWHPDRFAERSPSDAAMAETTMRLINDAWRVLGTQRSRATYDATLRVSDEAARATQTAPSSQGSPPAADGSVRIDPRLLDPSYLRNRADARGREVDLSHEKAIRMAPWLGLGFLLLCIFIFTAYASRTGSDGPPATVPGPPIPFAATSCLRQLSEGIQEVPNCDGANDGRIIAVRLADGVCPLETTLELAYKDAIICLEAVS